MSILLCVSFITDPNQVKRTKVVGAVLSRPTHPATCRHNYQQSASVEVWDLPAPTSRAGYQGVELAVDALELSRGVLHHVQRHLVLLPVVRRLRIRENPGIASASDLIASILAPRLVLARIRRMTPSSEAFGQSGDTLLDCAIMALGLLAHLLLVATAFSPNLGSLSGRESLWPSRA